MGKNSFSKYRRLAKRRVQVMVDGEAHACIVARAMKKNISIYQAGTEIVLAGAAYLAARELAEKEHPLKILLPTETTDQPTD